ncbi:MAG TPA: catalase [Polyangiaceae bacterium]
MAFGEIIPPGESEFFRKIATEIAEIQAERVRRGGPAERVTHVKQHLGAVGELAVTAPPEARHGVFAELDKRWPVYARFSNGSGRRQPDGAPDARGFALKLVGVPGSKLIEGLENEVTQDFLFIDSPALPFRGPEAFMTFLRAAKDGPAKLLPRLIAGFGFGTAFGLLWKAVTAEKMTSFATHPFYTAAPIAFGGTAAKLGLFPEPDGVAARPVKGGDYLRDDLLGRLRAGALVWSLRAQRFVDERSTPIEDASVEWKSPWLELGRLTLAQQDVDTPRGREIEALVAGLSFDPWHAIEAHRPLGAIMRARRAAYAPSVIGRRAAPEPRSVLALETPL